jgi:hypothetical protein
MNIPIWPGSSSFTTGSTPFGFYDTDPVFQGDADKFAKFAAQRLGYPIVDIELQDINFYTAFEEAITTYGNELYAFQIAENMLSLQGANTSIGMLNNQIIQPNLSSIIRLSEQYGSEAGVGGELTWYTASLDLTEDVQNYDLDAWASSSLGISGSDIEVKMILHSAPPAISRYYDPLGGIGGGGASTLGGIGGGLAPYANFLLMPISYDIQRIQSIELNDQIRRSQYSFELINNQLKLFPIPNGSTDKLYFRYILKSERNNATYNPLVPSGSILITNPGNVPYNNPIYSQINSIGRSWIFEYGLAMVKEILGYVRGKYSNIPIPQSEVTLNQSDLISAATNEKEKLKEKLKLYLGETSRTKLMENKSLESDYHTKTLQQIPLLIYVG